MTTYTPERSACRGKGGTSQQNGGTKSAGSLGKVGKHSAAEDYLDRFLAGQQAPHQIPHPSCQ